MGLGGLLTFPFNRIAWWLKAGIWEPEELGSNSDTSSYKLVASGKSLTSLYLYFTCNVA